MVMEASTEDGVSICRLGCVGESMEVGCLVVLKVTALKARAF
jgi:hypothetical protein